MQASVLLRVNLARVNLGTLRKRAADPITAGGLYPASISTLSVNANAPGAAIVRSVLGLGHATQLVVLAEGVETSRPPASSNASSRKIATKCINEPYLLDAIELLRAIAGSMPTTCR